MIMQEKHVVVRRRSSRRSRSRTASLVERAVAVSLEMLEGRVLFSTFTVTDTSDSIADTGSLRYQLSQAQNGDTITFDSAVFNAGSLHTITVSSHLEVSTSVTITGTGAQNVTIDGGNSSGVFLIDAGVSVQLSGVKISGGNANIGGGIDNLGSLTLSESTITGNTATTNGGGIYSSGTLNVSASTFSGNSAVSGAGVFTSVSTAIDSISNSTLTGNTASGNGGAIYNSASVLSVIDSTVTGNSAVSGGGMYQKANTSLFYGTILSNNSGGDIQYGGTQVHGKYDLVDEPSTALNDPSNILNTNPQLGSMGYFGGPTQTFALLPNSPAIGAGTNVLSTDQRGLARSGSFDIGAFQTQGADSLVVNTVSDDPVGSGFLSLRDAIGLATATGGNQTISFDGSLSGTINLNGSQLEINDSSNTLTINGASLNLTVSAGTSSQVLTVDSGSTVAIENLTLSDGSAGIAGGAIVNHGTLALTSSTVSNSTTTTQGGGIFNDGTLTLNHSTITGNNGSTGGGIYTATTGKTYLTAGSIVSHNTATNTGGGIYNHGLTKIDASTINGSNYAADAGGGIWNDQTLVILDGSNISGNTAGASGTGDGGGIYAGTGATTSITDTTISNNSSGAFGGGLWNDGTMIIDGSTIAGSQTTSDGGGIWNSASLTISSSTISGNTASRYGAGLYNVGSLTLSNSTIANNSGATYGGGINNAGSLSAYDSTIALNSASNGGGIAQNLSDPTATLQGTIVSGNQASSTGDDLDIAIGAVTGSYDLTGDVSGTTTLTSTQSQSGSAYLSPLGNYGGPTQTIAPLVGSLAFGNGATFDVNSTTITTDQRGFTRPVSGSFDIGAFQSQGSSAMVVNTLSDDPVGAGFLTLRDAIGLASVQGSSNQTITFDPSLASGTLQLNGSALEIDDSANSLTIDGGALNLTLSGQGTSNIFTIDTGSTVELDNLTITGGAAANGAGISNSGTLSIVDSAIRGNTATTSGGGIENLAGGSLSITGSTISGNSAKYGAGIINYGTVTISDSVIASNVGGIGGGIDSLGNVTILQSTIKDNSAYLSPGVGNAGGIRIAGATLTITGSTISGNTAVGAAGGIYASGATNITNSTISGNSAYLGGAIYANGGAVLTLIDSTISANTASNQYGGIGGNSSQFTAALSGTILAGNTNGDITVGANYTNDHSLVGGDPMLSSLGNYGGTTQTMIPLAGSPAIGAGADFSVTTDQRGLPRVGPSFDIGAVQSDLVVNTTGQTDGNGLLTLRDAVNIANLVSGNQNITFDSGLSGETITLNGNALEINDSSGVISITGLGASNLTVDAAGNSAVFVIDLGSSVSISGLTITGGSNSGNGGIINSGTLTLTSSTVTQNSSDYSGGGIYNATSGVMTVTGSMISDNDSVGIFNKGHLTITTSTISGNSSTNGGGIYNAGTLLVTDSTITNNAAQYGGGISNYGDATIKYSTLSSNFTYSNGYGGAIYNSGADASMDIVASTITSNQAGKGAGIANQQGTLTIENSTITGNDAASTGGAIFNNATLTVTDSTIAVNQAAYGGGIYQTSTATAAINGTIIAANTGGGSGGDDIARAVGSTLTGSFDLVGDATNASTLTSSRTGATGSALNPMLSSLGNYGGVTQTMVPLAGSLALGTGYAGAGAPTTDQRGIARPGIGANDIGAFQTTFVVNTTQDTDGTGLLTLRDAINLANLTGGDQTITFDPSLSGSIALSSGQLEISDATGTVTIDGGSLNLTIDAQGDSRVLLIDNGSDASINKLTLANGSINGIGGGIDNLGTLTLLSSTITGSHAIAGAGLYNYAGATANIYSSNISGNTATGNGGGIANQGTAQIVGSQITSNSAVDGAGLYNGTTGALSLNSTQISSNTASGNGGGLSNQGSANLQNATTIFSNTAAYGGGIWTSGTLVLTGSTLQGNSSIHNGGGLYADTGATVTIAQSGIFSNNSGQEGGGIYVNSATVNIENSTLEGNSSDFAGAAIYNLGNLNLTDSTISGSTSGNNLGAIYNSGSTVYINGTIVANTLGGGPNLDGAGAIQGNNNLIDDAGTGLTGSNNLTNTSANLGDLGFYGGITETMPLTSGSAAIGAGADFGLTTDQRGLARPSGTSFDIGAFQTQGATLVVTTVADDNQQGQLTLRNAIALADASGGTQTINFASGVTGTITLAQGQLYVSMGGDLTISNAGGPSTITVDANGQSRVFDIASGSTVTIDGLTITGGSASNGAGIENSGDLTVSNSIVTGNTATGGGGGIYNGYGYSLTISGGSVTNNTARNGGGVYSEGNLSISGATFSGNTAGFYGGAVALYASGGNDVTVTITNSSLINNTSAKAGGAITGNGSGSVNLTISGSTLSGNSSASGGGNGGAINIDGYSGSAMDLTITNSTLDGNAATDGAGGAVAFRAYGGTLTITSSTLSNNSAQDGGGAIFAYGGSGGVDMTITGSTLNDNSTQTAGGAIYEYFPTPSDITITITNSTVSGNNAAYGGGIYNGGYLTIQDSTISNNNSEYGGGIFQGHVNTAMYISGTIVAGNTASGGNDIAGSDGNDIGGSMSGGYDLIGDTSNISTSVASLSNSQLNVNPMLAPLGYYNDSEGGLQTMALLNGSPAIYANNPSDSLTVDERGVSRSSPGNSIGAFQSRGFVLAITGGNNQSAALGQDFADQLTVTLVSMDQNVPVNGDTITFAAPNTGASAVFSANPVTTDSDGSASVTATASGAAGDYVVAASDSINPVTTFNLSNTIGTADVTLSDLNQTYSGSPEFASAATNPTGLDVIITYSQDGNPVASPTDAGSYDVTATVNDPNYVGSTTGTLVISAAPANITLDDLAQTYTGSPEFASASTSPNGLDVSITYSQNGNPVAEPTNAGSYDVTATITTPNYQGTQTGTLVISPATISITLSNLNQTYTGSPESAAASTLPLGVPVTFTYSQGGNPVAAPTNAGSYSVVAVSADPNYTGTSSGTLVINQAAATVTLGNVTQTYTGSAKSVTASTTPPGLNVVITYTQNGTAVAAPTNPGVYTVTATVNDSNYQGSTTGTLTIDQAPAVLSASSTTFTTGVAGTFTVTTASLPAAALSVSGTLPAGVTFIDNGDGTATLFGTPAIATQGVYSVTITASNGIQPDAVQAFTLTVVPQTSATSPTLSAQFTATPTSVPVAKKSLAKLSITNAGSDVLKDSVSIQLYASPTKLYNPNTAVPLTSQSLKVNLKANKSKKANLRFASPDVIATGDYYLVAVLDSGLSVAASTTTTHFESPTVDLGATFVNPPSSISLSHNAKVKVRVTNSGNVKSNGSDTVSLYASLDQTLDTSLDAQLAQAIGNSRIAAGKSKVYTLKISSSTLAAGNYFLVATVSNSGTPADANQANNTVFTDAAIAISD